MVESLQYTNKKHETSETYNLIQDEISQKTTKGTEYTNVKDSRISNKITKSILENEKGFLKNPQDYDKIIEVYF